MVNVEPALKKLYRQSKPVMVISSTKSEAPRVSCHQKVISFKLVFKFLTI